MFISSFFGAREKVYRKNSVFTIPCTCSYVFTEKTLLVTDTMSYAEIPTMCPRNLHHEPTGTNKRAPVGGDHFLLHEKTP